MNRKGSNSSSTPDPAPFLVGVEAALRRSAARALAIARATGTPCFVWQDGRIVDIASADKARVVRTKVPGRD